MGESGVLLSCRAYDLIHYLRFVLGSNSRRKDIWRHYSKLSELSNPSRCGLFAIPDLIQRPPKLYIPQGKHLVHREENGDRSFIARTLHPFRGVDGEVSFLRHYRNPT